MGKMILLVVLGCYIILGRYMFSNNDIANDAINNVVDYYGSAEAKHIAASGANLAVAKLYKDKTWSGNISNESFSGGKLNVEVDVDTSLGTGGRRVISIGKYTNANSIIQDTVIVNLNIAYFSKYMMFSNIIPSNGYYVTGDVMDGPFHTNSRLNISGSPIFRGRVTMGQGPMKLDNWYDTPNPQFIGGYEYGVHVNMPSNLGVIKDAANTGGYYKKADCWITFNDNNTVSIGHSATSIDTTAPLSVLAPNGIIAIEGTIHIKGKIDGSATVASIKHNMYLDDDVGVVDDPQTDPHSDQMLGLCSEKKIYVTDNTANKHDININAAMFTLDSFEAENYGSRGKCGFINLYGSLAQNTDGYTGSGTSGSGVKDGFNLNYKYDQRFYTSMAPPEFPTTDRFQILSWWE